MLPVPSSSETRSQPRAYTTGTEEDRERECPLVTQRSTPIPREAEPGTHTMVLLENTLSWRQCCHGVMMTTATNE